MKSFKLILSFLLLVVSISPIRAEETTYQPLVVTFHDAYLYYVKKVKDALKRKDQNEALRYYTLARIYATNKQEAIDVEMLMHEQYTTSEIVSITQKQEAVQKALDNVAATKAPSKSATIVATQPQPSAVLKEVVIPTEDQVKSGLTSSLPASSSIASGKPVAITTTPTPTAPRVVSNLSGLGEDVVPIIKTLTDKQVIEIPIGRTLIIERNGLKRFFVVDEGFVDARILDQKRLQITALKRGSTYMHIWDDAGRTTVFLKVIFIEDNPATAPIDTKPILVEHNQPFRFSYSTDWSAYYQAPKLLDMQRQYLSFLQNIAVEGPTPYGYVDSYLTFTDFDSPQSVQGYTLGFTGVPVKGTNNVNVRLFDATRHLSPFTMSGPHLRGVFTDVNVLNDNLRFSYSHGQVRPSFGFLAFTNANKIKSYINAGKITLFPLNRDTHYAINFASGYGEDRDPSIAKQAYSIEAQQKIDHVTLNAELARNSDERNAMTSGLRYENGSFMSSLNFRNVNKNYTNILNYASYQGEIGTTWATNYFGEIFDAQTYLDVYQNRLYFNPNNEDALNTDFNGHFRMPFSKYTWTEGGIYYTKTPGELSPRENFGIDDRLSMSFDTWSKRHGIAYIGGAYQRTRYEYTPDSAFDRLSAIVGISMPLTERLSANSKYELSWVSEPSTGNDYTPSAFDIGLNYNREITKKLLGTWGLNYRNEDGADGRNSFLAGEDSIYGSFGLNYTPKNDVNVFFDSRLRRVWPFRNDTEPYYALDMRVGLRMAWGSGLRADPFGKVRGYVFNDLNNNALKEKNEQGIPNVKVKVGDVEVTTDENGYYEKSYRASAVVVAPVAETVPTGYVFSTNNNLRVPLGQLTSTEANFGVASHSSAHGVFYIDRNNNGQPDVEDQFVPRIKVMLDGKDVQYTDNRGAYYFQNIESGKHTITFDLNTLPIEMVPMTKVKNEVNVAEGTTFTLHFPLRVKEQQ